MSARGKVGRGARAGWRSTALAYYYFMYTATTNRPAVRGAIRQAAWCVHAQNVHLYSRRRCRRHRAHDVQPGGDRLVVTGRLFALAYYIIITKNTYYNILPSWRDVPRLTTERGRHHHCSRFRLLWGRCKYQRPNFQIETQNYC